MSEHEQPWTEDHRTVAKAYYEYYASEQRAAQQQQVEFGKWLLATLVVVNGGAIALLAQAGATASQSMMKSGPYFVAGIVTALFCGFFSWANAGYRDTLLDSLAKPDMLVSQQHWPTLDQKTMKGVRLTYYAAIACGVFSTVFFASGSYVAGTALPNI